MERKKRQSRRKGKPSIFYKPQGKLTEKTNLLEKDFVLAIQTLLQAEVLKTCGPNNVVCIDATRGTNGYEFSLITVVVVDEFGEGYPIAWCLSNRTDMELLGISSTHNCTLVASLPCLLFP